MLEVRPERARPDREEIQMKTTSRRTTRVVALGALGLGLAAGSYGVARAATASGSTPWSTVAAAATTTASTTAGPAATPPWGGRRSDETLLTGDTAAKVKAAALARVPGGTVVRVETDADGHALYEAHMTRADGTPLTVYVDASFKVVAVDTGMPARPGTRRSA
jgi:hypothetical protein